ncbi:2OG-Fe(II) oxygenase [Plesiocystis pacifica SIR-1]|uniref:2OG-Fe(II) oxygenase n=1 Tax=Plesiocystis pacifica SIR-1 TaxID=391625 RepID=A6GHE3_9BACT|nr:alpha-ketoglutarate-dependent dioxygenase AlkB [Plesiocystis pacifica]EDM74707.1 2OG-Fe(II) oxygenase [Plesiocystis pacifica SIR-1]
MRQPELFPAPSPERWRPIDHDAAAEARIFLREAFLDPEAATTLYAQLRDAVPWRQDELRAYGKTHPIPRLHQWYADDDSGTYVWSGLTMHPLPWTPPLDALRRRVEAATRRRFNSALINYYRDGRDTVGWHADDEVELGPAPFIASVSLGAERDFLLRRVANADTDTDTEPRHLSVALPHGSLLVMAEGSQARWQHTLPRRTRVTEGRINLTFRHVSRATPLHSKRRS